MIRVVNTLRPRQNGRHFADDNFKCIFLKDNVLIWIKISLSYVPKGPIINIPTLVQIMAWRRPGDKPLSEPMMFSLLKHICVTRPQLVYGNKYAMEIHWEMMSWWMEFSRYKVSRLRLCKRRVPECYVRKQSPIWDIEIKYYHIVRH